MTHTSLPILTAAEMRFCDEATIRGRVASQVLMERAAREVAEYLLTRRDMFPAGRVLVLCGSGNNGGDGFAAARFLADGSMRERREVVVLYLGAVDGGHVPDTTKMSAECARQYQLAAEAEIPVLTTAYEVMLADIAVVVDAVFGIGLCRAVSGVIAEVFEQITAANLPVLAVDIPSGIHADTGTVLGVALRAQATVTMQALKAGLLLYPGADYAGVIAVRDIGIDVGGLSSHFASLADASLLRRVLCPRERRSHKGTYGRVALICGSVDMSGAAVLSARAALRSGAGLVDVMTAEENRLILQIAVPEAIVTTYESAPSLGTSEFGSVEAIAAVRRGVRAMIGRANGVVIGCGLGQSSAARVVLQAALNALPRDGRMPVVLDADALNLLAEEPKGWEDIPAAVRARMVITPHPTEMGRLSGIPVSDILADPVGVARAYAEKTGVIVVLKDAHTVVASPGGQVFICAAGNAGMATGGSGDVLAGMLGTLLVQVRERLFPDLEDSLTVAEAVAAGVYWHAAAGDAAAMRVGEYGLTAGDIIRASGEVVRGWSETGTKMEC